MKGDAISTIDTPGKGGKCRDERPEIFTKLQARHQTAEVLGAAMLPKSIAEDALGGRYPAPVQSASAITALFLAVVGAIYRGREIVSPTPPISSLQLGGCL